MTNDATHLLTTISDVFWAITDMLDPTSLAFCSQVNRRWHALVRARPAMAHRVKPAYQVGSLLSTPATLEWGWKHAPLRMRKKFCKAAAARGDLQSLQWLRAERDAPWDESVCAAAALGGHLDLLQWARKAGAPWNAAVLKNAAKGGHFAAFRWARQAKAPWDGKVLRAAAKHGNFEIFRWCFRHRAPSTDTTERFAGYFAAAGCLKAVRWMYEGGLIEEDLGTFRDILVSAALGGHPQILRWLTDAKLVVLDEDTVGTVFDAAAVGGRLAILQWLQRRGFQPSQYVCEQAASGGHLECLRWAVAQEGIALTSEVLVCAARSGNLSLLQWACARGAPWTNNVYSAAFESGSVELTQWVLDQRENPDDPRRIEALEAACSENTCVEAARNGKLAILEWAVAHGAKITTRRVGALAAKGGHLDIIKWLHARGDPLAWDVVVEYAAAEGHLSVVRWAVANGAPRDGICGAAMSGKGHFEILRWAVDEAGMPHSGADHPMFYVSLETLAWTHARGFRIDPNHAYLEAAKCDDTEMLQWALRTFGPPGDELYKLALETRAVDFLDRLHKHGVEWASAAKYVPAPNDPAQAWMRAIGSPWGDSEAATDGDETSSQSDEEEFGEHPRSTQDYYESLPSGSEESDGEASGPNDEGAHAPSLMLQTDLIEAFMRCKFTGISGFSDGRVVAFLNGEIDASSGVGPTQQPLPPIIPPETAEATEDIQKNLWPSSDDEDGQTTKGFEPDGAPR